MLGSILTMAAPIVVKAMLWAGFKEEQIKKFMDWVRTQQSEAPRSTLPAEQDQAAEAKLKARIEAEQKGKPPA